ncbi:sigma-54-dependent transcriptional regulator [Desulfotalea psychrophila]|uniref:Probable two-component system response regulator (Ntr family) n=1 Tax=Desulfotalea psychrophila (strain LSv54 / DSM 12343) TaxID=177439 RepID=Q6APF5_DESPS|nr:sigma-54 dependent transcriptional regulator [Desulfotalea psychrophila]CAG35769.1 probable two-component system response regulator (Ntr family) [Desulfotalea psychrophila LSv54]
MKSNILIIEDDQDMCDMLAMGLRRRGFAVSTYISGQEGLAAINPETTDVVLSDINLPDANGLDICKEVVANTPDIPVIIMTAFGSMDTAISAIRSGAYDFVTKPLDIDILALSLERAVQYRELKVRVKKLSDQIGQPQHFDNLMGESPVMEKLFSQLARIADSEASLLISGESGSGKELTAKAVHTHSRRRDNPLITINCAAMPGQLLESELFGHKKGAFTDAQNHNSGLFMAANGGTLFLDEVGEIPLKLQPKLLRALEERCVRPVGGQRELPFDVRIIAATNRDLESAVEDGLFREDLYYRLNVIKIELPPLRSRGADILLLAKKFMDAFATRQEKKVIGFSDTVAGKLLRYAWPGNVRELRNAIEHAVALTAFDTLMPEDLPEKIRHFRGDCILLGDQDPMELVSMEEMERRYITHVLKVSDNNRTLAARILQLDRKTLYRKLQRYEESQG